MATVALTSLLSSRRSFPLGLSLAATYLICTARNGRRSVREFGIR